MVVNGQIQRCRHGTGLHFFDDVPSDTSTFNIQGFGVEFDGDFDMHLSYMRWILFIHKYLDFICKRF